jgi:hypothetical protein
MHCIYCGITYTDRVLNDKHICVECKYKMDFKKAMREIDAEEKAKARHFINRVEQEILEK